MIVQPDFADHWKTEMLIRLVGSEQAVRCVLRFWAHCQNRRQWKFKNLSPAILSSICKWTGDEERFFDAMSKTYLDCDGDTVTAHDWKEINGRLLHNWKVGSKGGRPKKPPGNPRVSSRKPKGALDKSREDRVEKIEKIYSAYPRREAKPKALQAIAKALEKCDFETLLKRTEQYAQAREGEPKQFTPLPASWFNQERYNDGPESWKTSDETHEPQLPDRTDELPDCTDFKDRLTDIRKELFEQ